MDGGSSGSGFRIFSPFSLIGSIAAIASGSEGPSNSQQPQGGGSEGEGARDQQVHPSSDSAAPSAEDAVVGVALPAEAASPVFTHEVYQDFLARLKALPSSHPSAKSVSSYIQRFLALDIDSMDAEGENSPQAVFHRVVSRSAKLLRESPPWQAAGAEGELSKELAGQVEEAAMDSSAAAGRVGEGGPAAGSGSGSGSAVASVSSSHAIALLEECLERYLSLRLYEPCLMRARQKDREQDAALWKRMAALGSFLLPEHLDTTPLLFDTPLSSSSSPGSSNGSGSWAMIEQELQALVSSKFKSPRDKLTSIQNACRLLSGLATSVKARQLQQKQEQKQDQEEQGRKAESERAAAPVPASAAAEAASAGEQEERKAEGTEVAKEQAPQTAAAEGKGKGKGKKQKGKAQQQGQQEGKAVAGGASTAVHVVVDVPQIKEESEASGSAAAADSDAVPTGEGLSETSDTVLPSSAAGEPAVSQDSSSSSAPAAAAAATVAAAVESSSPSLLRNTSSAALASADDLLPALTLALLRVNPPGLHSALCLVEQYRRPALLSSEGAYFLTLLVSAVDFIRAIGVRGEGEEQEEEEEKKSRGGAGQGGKPAPAFLLSGISQDEFDSLYSAAYATAEEEYSRRQETAREAMRGRLAANGAGAGEQADVPAAPLFASFAEGVWEVEGTYVKGSAAAAAVASASAAGASVQGRGDSRDNGAGAAVVLSPFKPVRSHTERDTQAETAGSADSGIATAAGAASIEAAERMEGSQAAATDAVAPAALEDGGSSAAAATETAPPPAPSTAVSATSASTAASAGGFFSSFLSRSSPAAPAAAAAAAAASVSEGAAEPKPQLPLPLLAAAFMPPVFAMSSESLQEAVDCWLEDRACLLEVPDSASLTPNQTAVLLDEYKNLVITARNLKKLLQEQGLLKL